MPIKRRNNDIKIIPTTGIKDQRLSLSARGLLTFLYVMPEGVDCTMSNLSTLLGIGYFQQLHIKALISELIEAGYIVIDTNKDFILFDQPQQKDGETNGTTKNN